MFSFRLRLIGTFKWLLLTFYVRGERKFNTQKRDCRSSCVGFVCLFVSLRIVITVYTIFFLRRFQLLNQALCISPSSNDWLHLKSISISKTSSLKTIFSCFVLFFVAVFWVIRAIFRSPCLIQKSNRMVSNNFENHFSNQVPDKQQPAVYREPVFFCS